MMSHLPPGWPHAVYPPGSEDFEGSAVGLLNVLPRGYREQAPIHRYPVALAVMARHHAEASLNGARQAYRSIRGELDDELLPGEIDELLAIYWVEGATLAANARAVPTVERALRGGAAKPMH